MGQEMIFKSGGSTRMTLVIGAVAGLLLGFVIGILLGAFAVCEEDSLGDGVFLPGVPDNLIADEDLDVSKKIMDGISAARIEENLRLLAAKPHIAGKEGDFDLVDVLEKRFTAAGLHVQTTPYDVLLSYPDEAAPNSIRLLDASGNVFYDASWDESNLTGGGVPPYSAYSPSGLAEGDLVYAGYGRIEDYNWLSSHGVEVAGKVVLVKYGKIYRGSKVDIAAARNATGIILYSEIDDWTGYKIGDFRVYPEAWYLPPKAAQRGTIFAGDGDPLTPGYPANDLAYRYSEDKVEPPMPKIPCTPIGYGAALNLLRQLGGIDVSEGPDFKGGLNITYRAGGNFLIPGMKLQLRVTTSNQREKAENVFGIIEGTVEPDRYILFGNHRDAWINGAIDPSSGTAVMLEVARVMGDLVQKGEWKPRRSIMFCSWGAEEFGLIGSTEWVEHYMETLRERAVAYINVDIAVQGNYTFRALATPLMYNLVHDASKKVPNPNPAEVQADRPTVYDTWLKTMPWDFPQGNNAIVPRIRNLGSGSDYAPLVQKAGITTVDASYTFNTELFPVPIYPSYHTEFDTFELVKEHIDKDFECHAAVARVSAEIARSLADSLILPFNMTNYAEGLERLRLALEADYGTALRDKLGDETYDKLKAVIDGFATEIANFVARGKDLNLKNPFAIRKYNDQMMLLERAFLTPNGLPTRPHKKHLMFVESGTNATAQNSFPGLVDLLFEIDKEPARWDQVKQHFHVILQTIQSAGATLRDVTNFMYEKL